MAKIVVVQYVGPFDKVWIPMLGVEVSRGEMVSVSAGTAGRAPGEWVPVTADSPQGWPRRLGPDGVIEETHDPGEGLLAQVDSWAVAKVEG